MECASESRDKRLEQYGVNTTQPMKLSPRLSARMQKRQWHFRPIRRQMSQHAMTPGAVAADVGLGDDDLEMGAARHELEEVDLKPYNEFY